MYANLMNGEGRKEVMKRIMRVTVGVIALLTHCSNSVHAAEPLGALSLSEPLGVAWQDQLVSHDLAFIPGVLDQPLVGARESDGDRQVPCQVTDVVRHRDGSVASIKVWLMVSMAPRESRELVFVRDATPVAAGGVEVTEEKDTLLITTDAPGRVGLRIPRGGANYEWPVPAGEVPAPVQGLLLPSGAMTGPGVLDLPLRVISWRAEIVNSGPLFVDARIRYEFVEGYWNCDLRVVAGRAMIRLAEEFNTGSATVAAKDVAGFFRLPLSGPAFAPETVFFGGFNRDGAFSSVVKDGKDEDLLKRAGVRTTWFASPVHGYRLSESAEGLHYCLSGYPANQDRLGGLLRAVGRGGDAVGFAGLATEAWRNPLPIRFVKDKKGGFSALFPVQKYSQDWGIDGFGDGSPNYTGMLEGVPADTCRRQVGIMLSREPDEQATRLKSLFQEARQDSVFAFDSVRRWNYDWKDPQAGKANAIETGPVAARVLAALEARLAFYLTYGNLGVFSMGLHHGFAHGQYADVKAAADAPESFTPEAYERFRRLLTFNAAFMNSTASFPYGTGFHLNNPNMTIMACEARFLSSLLVREHPDYHRWGTRTVHLLRAFFERFTRPSGAAYENPHYVFGATLGFIAPINEMMMANGLEDVFDTELFRKLIRFTFDWIGVPDPRFFGVRTVLPLGNTSYQSIPKTMSEPLIRYFKDRHPELAGQLQWVANQTYVEKERIAIVKDIVPDLKSVAYEGDGISFRHGFGTPYETLMRFRAGDCDGHYEWEADQMIYTLYAKGQPINLNFANGYFPMWCRPWLRNRVSFDMKFEISERNKTAVSAVAFSPEADYLHARRDVDQLGVLTEYPDLDEKRKWTAKEQDGWTAMRAVPEDIPLVTWHRQIMFLKDADPKGPNYFVIGDNFGGTPTRPTDVNFWFLANSMERDGNLLHYDGQLDVDMDVFVHTPATFEPHTDSYGHQEQLYAALFTVDKAKHPGGRQWETQKLLRIRQAPGGGYLTVLYPRLKQDDPPARYKRLADHVVEVTTPRSRDVIMLRAFDFEYRDDALSFSGRSAAVRYGNDESIIVLNNEGRAVFALEGRTIKGEGPFRVTLKNGQAEAVPLGGSATVTVTP